MGDLAIAQMALPENACYEDLCFHAQQAAEKAIKAVYLHHKMIFRYTHDLEILIATLIQRGIDVPPKVKECTFLSVFAWEARYPRFENSVTIEEYQYAHPQDRNCSGLGGKCVGIMNSDHRYRVYPIRPRTVHGALSMPTIRSGATMTCSRVARG